MYILTEETPNPLVMKFIPGRPVAKPGETRDFINKEEAIISSLANALMNLEGVRSVYFGEDFISVTRTEALEFTDLRLDVIDCITDFYLSEAELYSGSSNYVDPMAQYAGYDPKDEPVVIQIQEVLETRVRPAVARDGGDIAFHGFSEGVVFVKMKGACSGCPSASLTLNQGVENMLKHFIPEVTHVRQV